MLIKGEAIRTARLRKRLSQRELAHGICAQATVCLIEKYDQNVAWDIINGLCQRLEIPAESVMSQPDDVLRRQLDRALAAFMAEDIVGCQRLLIPLADLIEADQLRAHYYTLQGLVALAGGRRLDEARFRFSQALNEGAAGPHDLFRLLAQLGFGYTYFRQQALAQAGYYILAARDGISQWPSGQSWELEMQLFVLLAHAELLCAQGHWRQARVIAADGLERLNASNSMFIMERLIFVRARAALGAGDTEQGRCDLESALFIAKVRRHPHMEARINALLQTLDQPDRETE